MDLDEQGDAFSVRDLWRPSRFAALELEAGSLLFPPLEIDVPNIKVDNPYSKEPLHFPDLDAFQFGPLEQFDVPEDAAVSSAPDHGPAADEAEDLWKVALDLGPLDGDVRLFTWEKFAQSGPDELRPVYLSEAGPNAYDAALQVQADGADATQPAAVLRSDVLLMPLLYLGLGRSSALFAYDEARHTFVQAVAAARMSGYSFPLSQSFIARFVRGGNHVKHLKAFVETTYTSSLAFPAKVALADAVSSALSAIESYLSDRTSSVKTFLQLQELFARPHLVLARIKFLVDALASTRSNEELASKLYHKVQHMEQDSGWLRAVVLLILGRVCKPWLELVEAWTGLRPEDVYGFGNDGHPKCFVEPAQMPEEYGLNLVTPQYAYAPDMMPEFITDEDGRMIFETGKSLRFLRTQHPRHPISTPQAFGIEPPTLDWKFAWEDFEAIAAKAREYEQQLLSALAQYRHGDGAGPRHDQGCGEEPSPDPFGDSPFADMEKRVASMMAQFDSPPLPDSSHDDLCALIASNFAETPYAGAANTPVTSPPVSLTSSLSFNPVLSVQARLINATAIRLFFRDHALRHHLSLQRHYQLFGDGVFISRLNAALFSPDMASAERQHGIVRTGAPMGLKLGSRSTWPPASSELRLALMGVLSESYYSSTLYLSSSLAESTAGGGSTDPGRPGRESDTLPGNLSFAVRTLSPADVEKCMDPHSLHALDFLRLQYAPPEPLHLVITPQALDKYDVIFKFLLRLTRMLYTVAHDLARDDRRGPTARRFRVESTHFVGVVAAYFLDTGVRENWAVFEGVLDRVEERLDREDGHWGQSQGSTSIDALRKAHEDCLDRIMFSLFLRRRQAQVMLLLDDIFEAILALARGDSGTGDVDALYESFRSNLRVFLEVCRGLVGKRGYAKLAGDGEQNTVDRLVLGLEASGYYRKGDQRAVS